VRHFDHIAEKRPVSNRWREVELPLPMRRVHGDRVSMWQHPDGTRVVSGLEHAELPDGSGEVGPQWHVSIAMPKARANAAQVKRALLAFGMMGTEEDNHEPGNARHFWLPVDPARRVECECKVTDTVVRDPDGHVWSNPTAGMTDPAQCSGCKLAPVTGRACTLHGSALTTAKVRAPGANDARDGANGSAVGAGTSSEARP